MVSLKLPYHDISASYTSPIFLLFEQFLHTVHLLWVPHETVVRNLWLEAKLCTLLGAAFVVVNADLASFKTYKLSARATHLSMKQSCSERSSLHFSLQYIKYAKQVSFRSKNQAKKVSFSLAKTKKTKTGHPTQGFEKLCLVCINFTTTWTVSDAVFSTIRQRTFTCLRMFSTV
jgi:hypothetical protein